MTQIGSGQPTCSQRKNFERFSRTCRRVRERDLPGVRLTLSCSRLESVGFPGGGEVGIVLERRFYLLAREVDACEVSSAPRITIKAFPGASQKMDLHSSNHSVADRLRERGYCVVCNPSI